MNTDQMYEEAIEGLEITYPDAFGASCVVVLSGGMDSTALLYYMKYGMDMDVAAISFYYGQRHATELQAAAATCFKHGVPHTVVDVSNLGDLVSNSALTNPDIDVPEGMYDADNMAITVVPNRNSILMNIAAGFAQNNGFEFIVSGMHAGDHAQYPDCRAEFITSFQQTLALATGDAVRLLAPFVNIGKHHIAAIGDSFGVDWTLTHTCYKNKRPACGRCGTCVERIEAFLLAGVDDPLPYDSEGLLYAVELLLENRKITPEQAQRVAYW